MGITRRDVVKRVLASVALSAVGLETPLAAPAGSRFVYANNSAYDTIDPHSVFDVSRAAVRFNLYDGLYRWVDNPPKLIPWLAESHSVSADGRVYTFRLRKDARFHDGRPVLAPDVVFSIDRILTLGKGPAKLYVDVLKPGSTQASDDHTVVFNLGLPSAIFLATVPDILIVNSQLVRANERNGDWGEAWLATHEAGSGSYMLRRHDPAIGFTASRNVEHFAGWSGRPIDELEFRTVLETNTRVLGLIRGDYQASDGYMAFDQIQRLRQSQNVQIVEQESMRIFGFALNNSKSLIRDVHFRRALSYAFDYDGFIKNIMHDSVTRNPGPNPITMWGTPPKLAGYTYDLELARKELAAVVDPLRPITINALAGFSESEQAAALFQSSLRKLGLTVNVETSPWTVIASRFASPGTMPDIVPVWKSAFYLDPNNWVGEMFGSAYHGPRTFSYYTNPEFDRLLAAALVSDHVGEREKLYERMTQIVTDEAASLFVYNARWYGPYSSKVENVRYSPVSHGQDVRWISMKR